MARATFESNAWIPEEAGSEVITQVQATSAVENVARREPMKTDVKNVPRLGIVEPDVIPKGTAYGEDASAADEVTLTARKFGKVVRIAEEDIDDSVVDLIAAKNKSLATGAARKLDNACLGTTAASNGTTVPFDSVYRQVSQYSSGARLIQTAGALAYADLVALLGFGEESNYAGPDLTVIANPAFRALLRGLDTGSANVRATGSVYDEEANTLGGHRIVWSTGAKTNATASATPTGNPLLIAVSDPNLLILGVRSGPEYMLAGADSGPAFLTDEALLKFRMRRGFQIGDPTAFAVLEITAS